MMTFSITFDVNSIYFKQIQTFRLIFEPLESILSPRFGFRRQIRIEKLIKSWLDRDIDLDRLDCQSLELYKTKHVGGRAEQTALDKTAYSCCNKNKAVPSW